MKKISINEAIQKLPKQGRIFLHGGAATPIPFIDEIVNQAERFESIEWVHLHTIGPAKLADPKFMNRFRITSLFTGQNLRPYLNQPNIDYLPCFLSEIPQLFRKNVLPLDVALIQVASPDSHGNYSLGVSVDVALAAVQSAKMVIALVNPKMPRAFGDGILDQSHIHFKVDADFDLPSEPASVLKQTDKKIGELAASLIEDGSTLQAGIGCVPDAILYSLRNHKHLGIHTEMWSDGTLSLIECGAVDNSKKAFIPGKTVASFAVGSRRLYDFIHDNPEVEHLDAATVNRVDIIARNPKVVSINSAIEIDLTGQVCADSVGQRIISGVGGQMDFVRGSTLSLQGRSIIAFSSRTSNGASKIVPTLKPGAGVVTTRAHVHTIITEYGIAELWGKTMTQRAKALIQIAHPEDRESLERQAFYLNKSP